MCIVCVLHGEADELGLVEVLGQVARLERVHRAEDDEHKVPNERSHERQRRRHTNQHHALGHQPLVEAGRGEPQIKLKKCNFLNRKFFFCAILFSFLRIILLYND